MEKLLNGSTTSDTIELILTGRKEEYLMFEIKKASYDDIDFIMIQMKNARFSLPDPSWFVEDDRDFFCRHIEESGFILTGWDQGQMAGFLLVRIPGIESDNLAYDLFQKKEKPADLDLLPHTAHMESCVIFPAFRGMHLQRTLMESAEKQLKKQGFSHLMATVHPDNQASLKNFLHTGYEIIDTVKKYGGLPRHILLKII